MLKLLTGLILMALIGCVAQQKKDLKDDEPKGEWSWYNKQLYESHQNGFISNEKLNHEFVIAKSNCKIESLKVPVPSPSCTQPPKQNCYGLTGFAQGFCNSYTPQPVCDYSSVNIAKEAQAEIFSSCMKVSGWEYFFFPYDFSGLTTKEEADVIDLSTWVSGVNWGDSFSAVYTVYPGGEIKNQDLDERKMAYFVDTQNSIKGVSQKQGDNIGFIFDPKDRLIGVVINFYGVNNYDSLSIELSRDFGDPIENISANGDDVGLGQYYEISKSKWDRVGTYAELAYFDKKPGIKYVALLISKPLEIN